MFACLLTSPNTKNNFMDNSIPNEHKKQRNSAVFPNALYKPWVLQASIHCDFLLSLSIKTMNPFRRKQQTVTTAFHQDLENNKLASS